MLCDNEQIQEQIEELMKKEQRAIHEIMCQIDEMDDDPNKCLVSYSNEVILRVGIKRAEHRISPNITFHDIQSIMQQNCQKTQFFGYKDSQANTIWIRNTRDLQVAIREYFANHDTYLTLVAIRSNILGSVENCSFSSEEINMSNSFAIKFGPCGEDFPFIIVSINLNYSHDEALDYLKKMAPPCRSVQFIDTEGDSFNLIGDDEWDYFLSESVYGYSHGRYSIVYCILK